MESAGTSYILLADKFFTFLDNNLIYLTIIFIIYIFRHALSNLLNRVVSLDFSYGQAKGTLKAITEQNKEQQEIVSSPEDVIETPNIKTEEVITEEREKKNWFGKMYEAFLEKDFKKAKEIFEEYIKGETDIVSKYHNKSIYLYLLYSKAGDKSAIAGLQDLIKTSDDDEQKSHPLFWLSYCYEQTKNYSEAIKLWEDAIDNAVDEFSKSEFIRNLADVYKNNNQPDRAVELLEARLMEIQSDEEKSMIYKALSEIEKKRGNILIAALALEKVVEYNPDDKQALFDAAFIQSEAELSYLAINNYDTLIRLDPGHSIATNNLGVEAEKMENDIKATELYSKSAENNNTLAMANLALRYLSRGFVERADDLINRALKIDEPHERVPYALSKVRAKEKEDKTKWDKTLRKASEFRNFMRAYIVAYFNENSSLAKFDGTWFYYGQQAVEFKIYNGLLKAEWVSKRGILREVRDKCVLQGTIHNNSAMLKYTSEPIIDQAVRNTLLGSLSSKSFNCYAYITPDSEQLHLTAQDPAKEFYLKFLKKSDSTLDAG